MATARMRRIWASIFLAASAALVITSAVVPLLDLASSAVGDVIEAEHAAGSCPTAHDHAVCMAWAGTKLLTAATQSEPPAAPGLVRVGAASLDPIHAGTDLLTVHSRAPPAL